MKGRAFKRRRWLLAALALVIFLDFEVRLDAIDSCTCLNQIEGRSEAEARAGAFFAPHPTHRSLRSR